MWRVDCFKPRNAKCNKYAKKLANKKVRRSHLLLQGGAYKRLFESWDISDWSFEIDKNSKKEMSK